MLMVPGGGGSGWFFWPKVHSLWVTPKVFSMTFKSLQHTGMQLEFLVYSHVQLSYLLVVAYKR